MGKVQPNLGAIAITSFFSKFVQGKGQRLKDEFNKKESAKDPRQKARTDLALKILEDPNSPQERIDWATKWLDIEQYPETQKIGDMPAYIYNQLPTGSKEDVARKEGLAPDIPTQSEAATIKLREQQTETSKQQAATSKAQQTKYEQGLSDKTPQYLELQRKLINDTIKSMVDSRGRLQPGFTEQDLAEEKAKLQALNNVANKQTGAIQPTLRDEANKKLEELEKMFPAYSEDAILQEFYKTEVGKRFQQGK